MKPQPPAPQNNGDAQALPSDLEAVLAKVAPERRAAFLRLRQRLQRHDDNDELLAVIDHLDSCVVLMDLVARQGQPETIAKTMAAVEKGIERQTAVTDRIDKRSRYLNLGWPLTAIALTAALCITGMAIWHDWTEKAEQKVRDQAAQAQRNTVEAQLAHNLNVAGAKLDFAVTNLDANQWGHTLTVIVEPGKQPGNWKLQKATIVEGGNAEVTLVDLAASPSPTASSRHR